MIRGKPALAVATAAIMAGCGSTSAGPERTGAEWPIPETGEAVVAAMNRMPATLGRWHQADASRGMVFYEHPKGQLGIEASDLEDLFADKDVTAEEAVERLAADLDPGTSRSCSREPYHCVLGESQGQRAMLWSHDASDAILVAVWPDDESHHLLAEAWAGAQN